MPWNRSSRLYDGDHRLTRPLALTAAALAIGLASCASFKHLTQVSNTFPPAKDCGKCHVDIYHEWSQSDHAHAYTNPHFREATDDYAFENCLSCHAPEPMLTAARPTVRSSGREEGVTCVSCHLEQGVLSGPLQPTGKVHPHPIGVRPEVYYDSGICGRCHEGTMDQWKPFRRRRGPASSAIWGPATRKVTQATGGVSNLLVAMEKEVPVRRHEFRIPPASASLGYVAMSAGRSGSGVDITVENRCPHDLPTGDFGFRVVTLEVFAVDGGGEASLAGRWELTRESGTALESQGSRTWTVPVPQGGRLTHAVLTRRSYDQDSIVLAQIRWEDREP